ncbi:MAG TPA: hypothetical protein VKT77_15190 [Chthonomonadaceae bacterium]|nr:hypothetical protein [Chthonomonadaceae bacterium]
MCCFSRQVISVTGTHIFARSLEGVRQALVYSMTLRAGEDLAMILPIPVRPGGGEDAVKFVSLEGYPAFFKDMDAPFAPLPLRGGPPPRSTRKGDAATLAVVEVGSFEASYVPTIADFGRLSDRFRLPAGTWDSLPQYKRYGFAVFKLKAGAKVIHPMAITFPRAEPHRLFFPTVHIHDGKVHPSAQFDHALYCQKMDADRFTITDWTESPTLSDSFMLIDKTAGLVGAGMHCYKRTIIGDQKNTDTWLA